MVSTPGPKKEPYRKSADEVMAALGTDAQCGLSEDEARARLARHGRNELAAEKPTPAWKKFLAQFANPLVILLLVATAISAVLWLLERDSALPYEAIAIFSVVLLNALMGYIQESRAEQAVAALRRMAAAHAHVIRGGAPQSVAAADVVPGDILLVEEGDTIAADARLIASSALQTAEAALTGESLPVSKEIAPLAAEAALGDRRNMVFSGTAATYGRGKVVVTATGMQTEMGRIAGMLEQAQPETTPLQKELARLGRLLGIVVIAIAVVMIGTIVLVEDIRGLPALFEVLILGVALAVAAVPEGLPAVVTAVLALGVQRMARRNAIVRHLAAVETLGSASVIASDKTGTLTRNEMTVRAVVTASGRVEFGGTGYAPEGEVSRLTQALEVELGRALTVGDRANNALLQERDGRWIVQGDPTEGALIVAARKAGLADEALDARFERLGEVPFSSARKLMSTIHSDAERDGQLLVFTKGAPDVLLGRCTRQLAGNEARVLDEHRRGEILRANEALAGEALRTIGVAYRLLPADALNDGFKDTLEHELVFAGLIGMIDPPRAEAKDAVARAKAAGIRPIMITGDHPVTAAVIAAELGITSDRRALAGAELEKMSDEALRRSVQEVSVFARVNPEHKLRIVKALQAGGFIVAMTGDGVNDAPALKRADIGVAMGKGGTDVAREASSLVLLDDNFATIVAAVREGRRIYDNIRKFVRYAMTGNSGEIWTIFLAPLLGLPIPLLPIHILWVNLVTDGLPGLALAAEPAERGLMGRPPRPPRESLFAHGLWQHVLGIGLLIGGLCLAVQAWALSTGHAHWQTMVFTVLTLTQMAHVLAIRSESESLWRLGLFTNKPLLGAVLLTFALQLATIYVPALNPIFKTEPLSAGELAICLAAAVLVWIVVEIEKSWRRRGPLTALYEADSSLDSAA